jgi:MFS family permease
VAFVVLLAVLFCNMVGLGAVFALLPDLQDEYDLPTAGLGLIGGASVLMAVSAQLTLARFADRGHTVRMLRAGIISMIVGFAWMAVATDLWAFVASRALTGLGAGLFVPACRRVIVARDPARAGELLGRTTAVEVAGFVLGPPLAVGIAAALGLQAPFALAAVLLASVGLLLGSIREPPLPTTRSQRAIRPLLRDPAVKAALLIGATVNLSVGAFEPVMAKQLRDGGASNGEIAFTLAMFGVPYVFLTTFGGRLADRYGPHRVATFALAATVPVVAALGFATTVVAICVVGVVRSVIDTISTPAGITAMARSSPPEHLAAGQGLYGAVSYTMSGFAAIAAAPLYQLDGPRLLWLTLSALMLVCVVCIARLTRGQTVTLAPTGPEPAIGA